jgi:putative membrane protein
MLASSLVAWAVVYGVGVARVWRAAGRGRGVLPRHVAAFALGWTAMAVALLSPLDEWSETLFVAHMAQHELLMVVAAPLVAFSSPIVATLWALSPPMRARVMAGVRRPWSEAAWAALTAAPSVWLLHAVALWVWHLPSLYDAALENEGIHAVQHLCFFLTASLFWWTLVQGRYGRAGYGAAVLYVFASGLQSGILGALITFSPQVLYPAYASTSASWGITPLEDQQLAGLLMWVPAGIVFVGGGLGFFAAWLRESDRRTRFAALATLVAALVGSSACASEDRQLLDIEKAITSLRATAAAVDEAWLAGATSGRYTQTALEQTAALLVKERDMLAQSPTLLATPRGAELSQQAEELSRVLASMWQAVRDGDAASARRHLAAVGSRA